MGNSIGVFVDDTSRIVVHPDGLSPDMIAQQINNTGEALGSALASRGHTLNQLKTSLLINCMGDGAINATRQLSATGSKAKGVVSKTARLLGPQLHFQGAMGTELRARAFAARLARRKQGKVWFSKMHKQMQKLLFICFVQSAALSGLTAFLPSSIQLAALDSVMIKMLRAMMMGRASIKDSAGVVQAQISNLAVLKYWVLRNCQDELRVRRVQWYQRWAANPQDAAQVTASVWGTTKLERLVGVHCRSAGGECSPWADQVQADLEVLASCSEDFEEVWRRAGSARGLFEQQELKKAFEQVDVQVLRAKAKQVMIPPPGLEEVPVDPLEHWDNYKDTGDRVACEHVDEDGTRCSMTFQTHSGMIQHLTRKHKTRPLIATLLNTACALGASVPSPPPTMQCIT